MNITKGIILAAGYGTRFLPVTKVVPKELLPIGNTPALDLIIAEFIASGLQEVLIIISPHKRTIIDYYRPIRWLERVLKSSDNPELLSRVSLPNIRIHFKTQRTMCGTGHALLQAHRFVGNDPVVVAYPDDIHFGSPPLTKQLIDCCEAHIHSATESATGRVSSTEAPASISILAAVEIASKHEQYGILDVDPKHRLVRGIVEKPAQGRAPSNYASIGRFLLQPNFFTHLAEGWAQFDSRSQREYYHIHALEQLANKKQLRYHIISGTHVDIGNPDGYLKALNTYSALRS